MTAQRRRAPSNALAGLAVRSPLTCYPCWKQNTTGFAGCTKLTSVNLVSNLNRAIVEERLPLGQSGLMI